MFQQIVNKKIFVTGGAGFIGSQLVRKLCQVGVSNVVVYDNLHTQVHGNSPTFPCFPANVRCVQGKIEDYHLVKSALQACDPDIIIHLAAETGTGQSQDEVLRYAVTNVSGTASLLQAISALVKRERTFLLSSSRSIYGEGPHQTKNGIAVKPQSRSFTAMSDGDFKVYDINGLELIGVPANNSQPDPLSVYASTKLIQEHLLLNCAGQRNLSPRILRFQNVYGPGQSLRNAYTGVLSIFTAQILAGKTIDLYEDGQMVRDFVFVDDVVDACIAALCRKDNLVHAIDIGSGEVRTIAEVASTLLSLCDRDPAKDMTVSGRFRVGDIRYACADARAAKKILNWQPKVSLQDGLQCLVDWAREEVSTI